MTGESVLKRTVKVEVINTPTTKRLDVSERLMECGEMYVTSTYIQYLADQLVHKKDIISILAKTAPPKRPNIL